MSDRKILVGVPCMDTVKPFWAHDYARLMAWTASAHIDVHQIFVSGTYVISAREQILRAAIEDGSFTHVLWLDSDMRFPKDVLDRWLPIDAPMLCANYTRRKSPYDPVAWKPDLSDFLYTEEGSTGLERAGACGFGVTLVRLEDLKPMKEPYFMLAFNPVTKKFMGEDFYHCQKLSELGVPVMVDHDLSKEVRHIGDQEYTYKTALLQREANQKEATVTDGH